MRHKGQRHWPNRDKFEFVWQDPVETLLASQVSAFPYLITLVVTDLITFGGASQAVKQTI